MKTPSGNLARQGRLRAALVPMLAAIAVLAAPHASADVIDFETVAGTANGFYNGGSTFVTGGFVGTVADSAYAQSFPDYEPGLAGATIPAGGFGTCAYLACPYGGSQYFAGLNDGSLTLARQDGAAFHLGALTFGAIGPDSEEEGPGGGLIGRLRIAGTTADGTVLSTWADLPALHYWADWHLDGAFAGAALTSVTIDACAFDGLGGCINGGDRLNAAQFAIDDLQVSAVPEPSGWLMFGAGLALVAGLRRRAGGRP